jgi:hypothetical protein
LIAVDFINKLIMKNNINRLGYYGAKELKAHPWMKGVTWSKFESKMTVMPFIPKLKK